MDTASQFDVAYRNKWITSSCSCSGISTVIWNIQSTQQFKNNVRDNYPRWLMTHSRAFCPSRGEISERAFSIWKGDSHRSTRVASGLRNEPWYHTWIVSFDCFDLHEHPHQENNNGSFQFVWRKGEPFPCCCGPFWSRKVTSLPPRVY